MYKVDELEKAYLDLCDHLAYADEDFSILIKLLDKYSSIDDPEENQIDHDIYCSLKSDLSTLRFNLEKIRSIVLDCI